MSCNCVTYQCLEVDFNPCSNGVELPLQSPVTANWTVQVEFNGTWIRLSVAVVQGENIIIPNILNEHYTHTIRLLDANKELFNDTCYRLRTMQVTDSTYDLQQPASETGWQWETYTIAEDGNAFDDDLGADVEIGPVIYLNNNTTINDWQSQGITRTGNTWDFSAIGGLIAGTKFSLQWRES